MSDALVIFAGAVVAPVGFVVCVCAAFLTARAIVKDWRRTFPRPRIVSVHEQAAADLADCDVALPEDQHRLRCGALLALMDSRSMLQDADALLKEHQS